MPSSTASADAELLVELARALHSFGTPSHQLEETLANVGSALRVESQFLVTPTSIMLSVGRVPDQLTFLERVEGGETNLDKLNQVSDIVKRLIDGKSGSLSALAEIRTVVAAPNRYGFVSMTAAYAVACGTAAVFFGGGWRELAVATSIGLVLGIMAALTAGHARFAGVFPALAACLATVASRLIMHVWQPGTAFIGALGGLIVLVPGYTLTVAMNEIAHRHLVSGTARVTGAVVTFLQMGLGLALGGRISDAILRTQPGTETAPVPAWAYWLSVALAAGAFTVLFQAHRRDAAAILVASLIALLTAQFGSPWLGPVVSVALSAWMLGIFSNGLARFNGRPASTTLVPGLLVLVPGSFGFRSVQALLNHDVVSGIEIGFSTTMTAMALVTGLFLANLVVPPRSAVH